MNQNFPQSYLWFQWYSFFLNVITSAHISDRIISEAKALLQYRNIADIAYVLGFDYPAYFNN